MNEGRKVIARKEIGCAKLAGESNVDYLRNHSVLTEVRPRVPRCGVHRGICFTLVSLQGG